MKGWVEEGEIDRDCLLLSDFEFLSYGTIHTDVNFCLSDGLHCRAFIQSANSWGPGDQESRDSGAGLGNPRRTHGGAGTY